MTTKEKTYSIFFSYQKRTSLSIKINKTFRDLGLKNFENSLWPVFYGDSVKFII